MVYFISGRVVKGDGYGRKIGFPTANIDRKEYLRKKMNIPFGVYAGLVSLENKVYKAGIVIGPKDHKGYPKLEAHLIGFKRDIYGKRLVFRIEKFLHKFKKYASEEDLKKGISKDTSRIKKLI
ncbi:MAG: riboflavin kinase [Candidatus Doudnabacteria bacterium]